MKILDIQKKYYQKIDSLDVEIILAHTLKKPREFVLAYPEAKLTKKQEAKCQHLIVRRQKSEPIAYLTGHKEFYGLDFKVTPDTLIPRPETELLVEKILALNPQKKTIIDVGTGSGNIIISLAKNLCEHCHSRESGNPVSKLKVSTLDPRFHGDDIKFFGVDISEKALSVAKYNAKKNKINKIKFIKSDLLDYFLKNNLVNKKFCNLIIVANLPYLSQKIYSETAADVKNFEPKSALYSGRQGLAHYEKLFEQILKLKDSSLLLHISCLLEFSPEQKPFLAKLIKKYFPAAKVKFHKDLAKKWRLAEIAI